MNSLAKIRNQAFLPRISCYQDCAVDSKRRQLRVRDFLTSSNARVWNSVIVSTAKRRGHAKRLCDKRDRAITCLICRDLHSTLKFSDQSLQKDLFKGEWTLAKSYFQNYCHAFHTRLAVFFPLLSCCVSSLWASLRNRAAVRRGRQISCVLQTWQAY